MPHVTAAPDVCGDVRYCHLADVQTALMNVRFEGNNGHDADVTRCLLLTQSGHCLSEAFLFPAYTEMPADAYVQG